MRRLFAKLLFLFTLEVGAVLGVPMRPDEIENLLEVMNRTQIVQVVKKEGE